MKAILPALALLAASCATTTNQPIVSNGPPVADGPVALGQPVRSGAMVATPMDVVEDSRCPINARCVWAGRVVVTTRIDGPGWRETMDLTLGEPVQLRGNSIMLSSVEPGRLAEAETPKSAYRFDFEP